MATTAPMRDGPPAGSSTGGDSRVTTTTSAVSSTPPSSSSAAAAAAATTTTTTTTNFDCDEEWTPIGIGNLIIDLDADIEKTNEKSNVGNLTSGNGGCSSTSGSNVGGGGGGGGNSNGSNNVGIGGGGKNGPMAAASSTNSSGGGSAGGKTSKSGSSSGSGSSGGGGGGSGGGGSGSQSSNIEHSSTVDKGLKLKIKRTKSGNKSSEKHEIVKTSEQQQQQNGGDVSANCNSNNEKGSSSSELSSSSSSSSGFSSKHSSGSGSSGGGSGGNVNSGTISSNANSGSGAANSNLSSVGSNSGGTTSMNSTSSSSNKRGGSSHRRDKTKDKHSTSGSDKSSGKSISGGSATSANQSSSTSASASSSSSSSSLLSAVSSASSNSTSGGGNSATAAAAVNSSGGTANSNATIGGTTDLNGIVRTPVQRVMYPMQTNGPGPPNAPGPPPSPSKESLLGKSSAQSAYVGGGGAGTTTAAIPNTGAGGGGVAQQTSSVLVTATTVASNPIASGNVHQSSAPLANNGGGLAATTFAAANSNTAALENGNVGLTTDAANTVTGGGSNMFTTSSMEDGTTRPQSPGSPPCKKLKTANCLITERRETKDACVGTSISTMTEPDCLGPCEPGTSVTLEGIVWHETEGVLVVNVTWRGKTYVGTLLDCTRHDWAPPRFCDSPTSDLDARLPKGRAKRGRTATNDLSNFTETRSSVHSKLRSSSNGSNKNARKGLSSSPTPFATPRPDPGSGGGAYANSNKRKSRPSEDESPSSASPQANGKKSKPLSSSSSSSTAPASPPSSPVFYECPETNCCKKYRHLNGLKYHQSHAHGGTCAGVVVDDDEATKESASMSETEELPSPVDQQSIIKSERKDETFESEPATPVPETSTSILTNHPASPHQLPPATASDMEPVPVVEPLAPLIVDNKTVMKPHAIRYGMAPVTSDEIGTALVTSVTTTTPSMTTAPAKVPAMTTSITGMRPVTAVSGSGMPLSLSTSSMASQSTSTTSPSPPSMTQQIQLSPSQPALPHSFVNAVSPLQVSAPSIQSLPLNVSPSASTKLPQFKVKPASALLQDDKAKEKAKLQAQRKKNRKSPAGSPHSHASGGEQPPYKLSTETMGGGREETRSPSAYSDISDDGAPVLEAEGNADAKKSLAMDKKMMEGAGGAQSPHALQHYNMYSSFYQQPPYLVPSVQLDTKGKDEKGQDGKLTAGEKEKKEGEMSQKLIPSSHYYYPEYMPGYGYNLGSNYPISMVSSTSSTSNEKETKDDNSKSPGPTDLVKQPSGLHPSSQALNAYPSPISKSKMDSASKLTADAYPSAKDRVEARSPLSASTASYLHAREQHQMQMQQQQQQQQRIQQMQLQSHPQQGGMHHTPPQQQMQQPPHHLQQSHQSHEDMRRYYGNMFPEQQRRKEQHTGHSETPLKATPPPSIVNSKSNLSITSGTGKHKDESLSSNDDKKEEKVKQEGAKPTMETQGPPPPPTSSYAYFPSPYLQAPYHGGIPFEQAHPMYRGMSSMIMPTGPYSNSPYLHHPAQMHAPMSRYHGPEDLSRPPSGSTTKALDMLHQASQYYPSSHKIHELQERAIKSPTPKVSSAANASPSSAANGQPTALGAGPQLTPTSSSERLSAGNPSQPSKASIDGKDSRSPPPQRHVHTHHHTHVGLGYPLLPGQYPAAYPAAAVLASEQAAGVASAASNPYSPK